VYRLTRLRPADARALTLGELQAWLAQVSDGPGEHVATVEELLADGG